MSWFSRKPTQEKYIEATATVASNLYLQTIPGAAEAPSALQFNYPDSRYRYLLFCLSSVVTTALAYDEKKQIQPETLIDGCLHFAGWTARQNPQEYFDDPEHAQSYADHDRLYFEEFIKHWALWPALEKEGRNTEIIDLITSIIHTTESDEPINQSDKKRLGPLALQIDCQLPTMRSALVELAKR